MSQLNTSGLYLTGGLLPNTCTAIQHTAEKLYPRLVQVSGSAAHRFAGRHYHLTADTAGGDASLAFQKCRCAGQLNARACGVDLVPT